MPGESTELLGEELDAEEETPPALDLPRTLRLLVAYDGTGFAGWQAQPGLRTVQGEIERAVRRVLAESEAGVVAAGRTDAGVHAAGQVAHVRTASRIPLRGFLLGVNSILGKDVRLRAVEDASAGFHARRSARSREYRYQIWTGGPAPPFLARYSHAVRGVLDVEAMRRAAAAFEGTHDLSAFRAASCAAASPVKTVWESRLAACGDLVVYAVRAPAFLQHMVRIIVGTLVEVGRGRLGPDDVGAILAAADRRRAPATAPARGLFLYRVAYGDEASGLEALPEPVLAFSDPNRAPQRAG